MSGYHILKEIETLLKGAKLSGANISGQDGPSLILKSKLEDASTRFYSVVPSTNPARINTDQDLKTKTDLLEALLQIEQAAALAKGAQLKDKHPSDANYEVWRCFNVYRVLLTAD